MYLARHSSVVVELLFFPDLLCSTSCHCHSLAFLSFVMPFKTDMTKCYVRPKTCYDKIEILMGRMYSPFQDLCNMEQPTNKCTFKESYLFDKTFLVHCCDCSKKFSLLETNVGRISLISHHIRFGIPRNTQVLTLKKNLFTFLLRNLGGKKTNLISKQLGYTTKSIRSSKKMRLRLIRFLLFNERKAFELFLSDDMLIRHLSFFGIILILIFRKCSVL